MLKYIDTYSIIENILNIEKQSILKNNIEKYDHIIDGSPKSYITRLYIKNRANTGWCFFRHPSENMSSSVGMISNPIYGKKTCSKLPTRTRLETQWDHSIRVQLILWILAKACTLRL